MTLDPRRMADTGWDEHFLEPKIKESTGRMWPIVPPMIASFDLETTGLGSETEPISFGMAIFRDGKLSKKESQHFLMLPEEKISEGAHLTHGWDEHALYRHMYAGKPEVSPEHYSSTTRTINTRLLNPLMASHERMSKMDKFHNMFDVSEPVTGEDGESYVTVSPKKMPPEITEEDAQLPPTITTRAGINKIVGTLSNLQKQGFVFLGANPTYDVDVIKHTWAKHNNGIPVQTTGFNPNSMRLIDVIKHDLSIEPHKFTRDDPRYRSRSLTNLADYYKISAGGHRALQDSIAAGRVFIEGQVPRVQDILRGSANQRRSFKLSSVEASALGIDYTMGGPCHGPDCGFCGHLNEIASSHEDPAKFNRVKAIMQAHQGL